MCVCSGSSSPLPFTLCVAALKKLITLFNNASRSQCIIDGEVLNRRWEKVFLFSSAAAHFERVAVEMDEAEVTKAAYWCVFE